MLYGAKLAGFIAHHAAAMEPHLVAVDSALQLQRNMVSRGDYRDFMAGHPYRYYRAEFIERPPPAGGLRLALMAMTTVADKKHVVFDADGFWAPVEDGVFWPGVENPYDPAVVSWYSALCYALGHGCLLPTAEEYDRTMRLLERSVTCIYWDYEMLKKERGMLRKLSLDDPRCDALPNGLVNLTGNLWHWTMTRGAVDERVLRTGFRPKKRRDPTVIVGNAAPARHSFPMIGFRLAKAR